ncbi:hypothetical protein IFM89_028565 [Coptis chinensis]|uniref:Uncharacterized protein n=1 Tax=Coptis chinensis TaxID=261450 RepID=A0A835IFN0_9MAGN|nr:hypothetical protein IFM89_028565 [Coptis chinensis]
MRIHRQNSGLEQTEMFQDSAKDGQYNEVSKARQLKGNQELNEELQMKADELEKLFAAHKLRVSGSQLVSSRRVSPVDVEEEDISLVQLPEKEFERGLAGETVVLNPNKNLVELGRLNNSRGKFYDLYMQKRDAKLRGEWDSRRVQNEEKMMEMSERLECCRAEMNAYFAVSSDQRESTLQSRRRAEKLRSFDMCLVQKNNEQQAIETTQIQDGGVSDSSEQIRFRGDTPFSEIHLENGSSRSTQSKKLSQSRTFSSSIPRSSAPPIPRPSSKGSNFGSARRRVVPENPVGQSLPNFSDFKEESTKPSPGTHKEVTRSQNTHIPRSKSTNGHLPSAKKDNVWRSQSMKKSSVSPDKSKEFLPPKANGANMTPARRMVSQSHSSRRVMVLVPCRAWYC